MNIDDLERRISRFVYALNREGITAETTARLIDQERGKYKNFEQDLFRTIVYNELWVEPESLKQRRINGELDAYFSHTREGE